MEETRRERRVPHHDSSVFGVSWCRECLCEGIRHHQMSAKRDKREDASCDQFSYKIATNVNVSLKKPMASKWHQQPLYRWMIRKINVSLFDGSQWNPSNESLARK